MRYTIRQDLISGTKYVVHTNRRGIRTNVLALGHMVISHQVVNYLNGNRYHLSDHAVNCLLAAGIYPPRP